MHISSITPVCTGVTQLLLIKSLTVEKHFSPNTRASQTTTAKPNVKKLMVNWGKSRTLRFAVRCWRVEKCCTVWLYISFIGWHIIHITSSSKRNAFGATWRAQHFYSALTGLTGTQHVASRTGKGRVFGFYGWSLFNYLNVVTQHIE